MNKPFAILLGVLLASPLVVLGLAVMGLTGDFDEAVPTWHAGDTWEYDQTSTIRASGSVMGLGSADTGALVIEMGTATSVVNTTHTIDDIPVYAAILSAEFRRLSFGGNTLGIEGECVKAPDGSIECSGAEADEIMDELDVGPCLWACGGGFLGFYTKEDLAFVIPDDPPVTIKSLDFPLTKGKTWTIVATDEKMEELGVAFELVAEAVEEEYIKLPDLGAVEAIRVEIRLSDASEAAFERAIIKSAQEGGATGMDFDMSFDIDTWYSPKHRNIVKSVSDMVMTTRMSAQGFTGSAQITVSMEEVMSGHESAAKPERPIREAERLAGLPLTGETPTTTRLADEPWYFTVAADQLSVDATAGEEITLGLLDGWGKDDAPTGSFATPPAGSTVSWTHRFLQDGEPRIERAEGATTTTTIRDPGLHVFTARVYDHEGSLLGADDIIVEGYSRARLEAGPVGLGDMWSASIPVPSGALWGRLMDETDGPFVGTLTLTDAEGTTVAEKENGLVKSDRLADLTPFATGDWDLVYDVTALVGHAEAVLEIHYMDDEDRRSGWTTDDNLLPCVDPFCDIDASPDSAVPRHLGVRGLAPSGLLDALLARLV